MYNEQFMRKMSSKRAVSSILAAIMIFSVFSVAGCSDNSESSGNDEKVTDALNTDSAETEPETLTRAQTPDFLPDNLDLDAITVNILCRTKNWFTNEMTVDEISGEIVNDAVYDRNLSVSDRLNVNLNYIKMDDVTGAANTSITAGSDDYQIVVGSAVDIVQYGARGQYYNLLNPEYVTYLDLSQPWWAHHYTDQSTIAGKCFFVTGDLALSLTQLAFVTFFNKQMVTDMGIEDPYQLVRDGTWTIDKQMEMTSDVYIDLNGNSKSDKDDQFGLGVSDMISYDVYWSSFDLTMFDRDFQGLPFVSTNIEKFQSAVEKIYTLFRQTEGTYYAAQTANDGEQDDLARKFASNQLLFTTLRIMACDILREMDADYGIIPVPKWDEEQDTYYTFVHDQYSVFGIPASTQNPAQVSAVLEALASENYRYVTPAYYDVVLNGKYLRDTESSEMLEITMANVKIDFSWIYTYNLNSIAQNLFRYLMRDGSSDFTSTYAKHQKSLAKSLTKLVDSYIELEE